MTELLMQYLQAKRAEAEAAERRVELGNKIAAALGAPEEGSKTHEVEAYKVKVTQPVNRKVDWTAFDNALARHPGKHAPVSTKRELDLTGLRWVRENDPEFYRDLATAITATPGRVQLEVKEVAS